MATNLAGSINLGQLNACIVRAARLNANCVPTGGVNSGIVTAGFITLTAEPDIEEGQVFEPKNGCGALIYTYEDENRIKRYNLSGEIGLFDYEMMALLFGGSLVLGKAGGTYAGKVIGYADKAPASPPRPPPRSPPGTSSDAPSCTPAPRTSRTTSSASRSRASRTPTRTCSTAPGTTTRAPPTSRTSG